MDLIIEPLVLSHGYLKEWDQRVIPRFRERPLRGIIGVREWHRCCVHAWSQRFAPIHCESCSLLAIDKDNFHLFHYAEAAEADGLGCLPPANGTLSQHNLGLGVVNEQTHVLPPPQCIIHILE